uniref:Uncharacterized protein HGIII-36 n=1 Tax=uncultured Candidatus Nitrosocaldus sp. TaxID=766501 RepID=Q4LEG2_9ARCH|nr:hypothetical protein HGIII-36 [uncultured Candidatus Nitrosocaldus sp.]
MHKPQFMLEVYSVDYNIKKAFTLLHKVYEDVTDSLSNNNRIPYYVEAELLSSTDGYGDYTLLIYYYDYEQEYGEMMYVGEDVNHVKVSMDAFNLIDLNPDCSTLPARHRFSTLTESLQAYTMDIIKRLDASYIESISLKHISTDEAYIYYLAEVAKVNGYPLSEYPYIPFLLTVKYDSGIARQIFYVYVNGGYITYEPRPFDSFLYNVHTNLQYILAIIITGCIAALLLWLRRGHTEKVYSKYHQQ